MFSSFGGWDIFRTVIYNEPRLANPESPCDDCSHRRACGASGQMCAAFSVYMTGNKPWQRFKREPSVRATAIAARVELMMMKRHAL